MLHLKPRILDLLEVAGYVFATDRLVHRGAKSAVEYQGWSRSLEVHVRVRDVGFWSQERVGRALSEALEFMTGDHSWRFVFSKGHSTPPTSLFDREGIGIDDQAGRPEVVLFSGGLDSLAGCLKLLENTSAPVVLVSHESQSGTMKTQRRLVKALRQHYQGRLSHAQFLCQLKNQRGQEETQRTRSFLYCSIGFAIANAHARSRLHVPENGITSINLYRREDLANARASRTTHPKSMNLMARLLSLVAEEPFRIDLPFVLSTKRDVLKLLRDGPHAELISSAVSCSRTFQRLGQATHCGECFQCVDRRLTAFAAGADDYDHPGLYATDIVGSSVDSPEAKTTIVDYLRQARGFAQSNIDYFESEYLSEVADILDALPGAATDNEKTEAIWSLTKRHGLDVARSLKVIQQKHDDPYVPFPEGSLLSLVAAREYLKPEIVRLVGTLTRVVEDAIPEMFRRNKPVDEADLNAKVGGLLRTHQPELRSEHPTTSFACARVVADHELEAQDLLLEAKYVRRNTPPSKANEGIAADLIKYPAQSHILFLVYDPYRQIPTDSVFKGDIEAKGRCSVLILR